MSTTRAVAVVNIFSKENLENQILFRYKIMKSSFYT